MPPGKELGKITSLERARFAVPPGLAKVQRIARELHEHRGYYDRKSRRAWAQSVLRDPELAVQRYRAAVTLAAERILSGRRVTNHESRGKGPRRRK